MPYASALPIPRSIRVSSIGGRRYRSAPSEEPLGTLHQFDRAGNDNERAASGGTHQGSHTAIDHQCPCARRMVRKQYDVHTTFGGLQHELLASVAWEVAFPDVAHPQAVLLQRQAQRLQRFLRPADVAFGLSKRRRLLFDSESDRPYAGVARSYRFDGRR